LRTASWPPTQKNGSPAPAAINKASSGGGGSRFSCIAIRLGKERQKYQVTGIAERINATSTKRVNCAPLAARVDSAKHPPDQHGHRIARVADSRSRGICWRGKSVRGGYRGELSNNNPAAIVSAAGFTA